MQETPFAFQKSVLNHGDCLVWAEGQLERSIHAVVTDPPYDHDQAMAVQATRAMRTTIGK